MSRQSSPDKALAEIAQYLIGEGKIGQGRSSQESLPAAEKLGKFHGKSFV